MGYTGAWKRSVVAPQKVPLKPGPDPAHGDTSADLNGAVTVQWKQDTMVPSVPDEWLGDQLMQLPSIHGVAYDETPQDHAHGMGVGAGMDTLTAQDVRTEAHGEDLGAVDARRYQPAPTRDGSYTVAIIDDEHGNGASPSYPTMRYEQGAGIASDPYARTGRRIARWRDRVIDMHRWDPQMRGSVERHAAMPHDSAPMQAGNQYTSDEMMFAHAGSTLPNDKFVAPVTRRSPRPWDEAMTQDGVAAPSESYGLTSWGL